MELTKLLPYFMKSIRTFLFAAFAMAMVAALPIGCASKLESGGAYAPPGQAPDKSFYAIDASFDLAYSVVDAAFTFERNNRQWLWKVSPDIKHLMDQIRPQAADGVAAYARARREYLRTPTPAGLTALQTALDQMRRLSSAAQAALPKQ